MAKNPYTLLGVKKDATDDQISKAFRKLSKKYHPDVAKDDPTAEDKFKEISAAYSLLSDKDLRRQYDTGRVDAQGNQKAPDFGGMGGSMGGGNPFGGGGFRYSQRGGQMGGQMGGEDMSDLFSQLFGMNMGGAAGMGGMGGGQRSYVRPSKGADIAYEMPLGFMDAIKGTTKSIIGKDGSRVNVRIPAGVKDGQTLRVKGKGQPGSHGGPAGDARVTVNVRRHKHFTRDGNDLYLDLPVALQEAVQGAKVTVPTPGGDVRLSIPPGTSSGKTFRLKGKGVKGGNLYVKAMIVLDDADAESLTAWADAHPVGDTEAIRRDLL